MADIGLVANLLMETLANDAELTALCPGGVYWNLRRPEGGTAFVIVATFDHTETPGLGGTLYERTTYLVRSSILSTTRTPSRQAAARIQTLLHGALLDLTPAGYAAMDLRRTEVIDFLVSDPADHGVWYHSGGHYELMHYPTT